MVFGVVLPPYNGNMEPHLTALVFQVFSALFVGLPNRFKPSVESATVPGLIKVSE